MAPAWCWIACCKSFVEDLLFFDSDKLTGEIHDQIEGEDAAAYAALVLGTRDYVRKCGFSRVILGLSGGIDSALTAAIAAEAVGAPNVLGVLMPSPYSSPGSVGDARQLAENLGIDTMTLPIEIPMRAFADTLAGSAAGRPAGIVEENLQARIRGNLLMALSNQRGALLLTTGNK